MYRIIIIPIVILTSLALAKTPVSLSKVEVSGEKLANIMFYTNTKNRQIPKLTMNENVVELLFKETKLKERDGKKLDFSSPHVLIHRISVYESGTGAVKARIVLNGSTEKLKERLKLSKVDKGISLSIEFPAKASAALKLLEEEQMPLNSAVQSKNIAPIQSRWGEIVVLMVILIFLGVGGVGFYKYLKKKGKFGGSRKYLIEQLSYCPVGSNGKTGVCLLKIGQEFILVGVTPNQVNFLSSLSKLADQYENDSRFERRCFSDAVEEEYKRLNTNQRIPA